MSGILLDRPQFLALMDAAQANGVVGLDLGEIAPKDYDEHKALVEKGLKELKEAGVLREVDDVNVLDADLLSMAVLIAHPEAAVLTTREIPDQGQQLFLHYLAGDVIMEQTLPRENEFRWALVLNRPALAERVLGILPVRETAPAAEVKVNIGQAEFVAIKEMIDAGNIDSARSALSDVGITGPAAETLLETVAAPEFAGTVAVLRCQNDEIVDGRNLLVVQGKQVALLLKQAVPGEPTLEVTSCDAGDVRSLVTNYIYEMSNEQN